MEWIKNLFSEGWEASMLRLCVFIIVIAFAFKWVGGIFMDKPLAWYDIVAVLGAFFFKWVSKRAEALKDH